MKNALNWFEIPVSDFRRAKNFYEAILNTSMDIMEIPGYQAAMFPADLENGIGGCIMYGEGYEPSNKGSIIYLNAGADLNDALGRITMAGGQIIQAKTSIGENGFMALFEDTEGNKAALHSNA
ncbi:MAG: putative enzyme related to lactoylglutathione lyase [Marivirga sp.]|jgi:predicted enzyme related to lactoylglutathione lyase